jgi:hypothetical protein
MKPNQLSEKDLDIIRDALEWRVLDCENVSRRLRGKLTESEGLARDFDSIASDARELLIRLGDKS